MRWPVSKPLWAGRPVRITRITKSPQVVFEPPSGPDGHILPTSEMVTLETIGPANPADLACLQNQTLAYLVVLATQAAQGT